MRTKSEPLTERYLAAVIASLPPDRRDQVQRELRDQIDASVAQRVNQGVDVLAAEREVLTGLGDPMRLGAARSGRTLALISPTVYPAYIRLLRLLIVIVVPIITILAGIASAVAGDAPVAVLASAFSSGLSVGIQLTFWVTLVFVIIDRRGSVPKWDLDDLPALPDRRIGLGETLVTIAGLALLTWVILWQPGFQVTIGTGAPAIPILNPALSAFWIPYFVVVLLASIALEIVKFRTGIWTVPLAAMNTILNAAFAIPAVWLLMSDQVLNPAFVDAVAIPGEAGLGFLATLLAWLIAAVCTFDTAEGWWKNLRKWGRTATT